MRWTTTSNSSLEGEATARGEMVARAIEAAMSTTIQSNAFRERDESARYE
jgi:hypothetical protein